MYSFLLFTAKKHLSAVIVKSAMRFALQYWNTLHLDWKLKPVKFMHAVSTLRKSRMKGECNFERFECKIQALRVCTCASPNSCTSCIFILFVLSGSLCPVAVPPLLDGLIFNFTFFWVCNQLCVHARRHILMWRADLQPNTCSLLSPRRKCISLRSHTRGKRERNRNLWNKPDSLTHSLSAVSLSFARSTPDN